MCIMKRLWWVWVLLLILLVAYVTGRVAGYLSRESHALPHHKATDASVILHELQKARRQKPACKHHKAPIKNHKLKPKPKPTIRKPTVESFPKPASVKKRECAPAHPCLVIVIDDVHSAKELAAIRAIGYAVTPSIFPPYRLAPHTERLATGLHHYMIHLPLESGSAKFNRQTGTLFRTTPADRIASRIALLRRLFPKARYINNHTGSLFTSDRVAMRHLLEALHRYGFLFVDSYTTAHSVVRQAVRTQGGQAYIKRDIFLDNRQVPRYIRMQLRKAVTTAKRKGIAIAIGHPHPVTLQTLKRSKDILQGIAMRYIDEVAW